MSEKVLPERIAKALMDYSVAVSDLVTAVTGAVLMPEAFGKIDFTTELTSFVMSSSDLKQIILEEINRGG